MKLENIEQTEPGPKKKSPKYAITSAKILSDAEFDRFITLCERQLRKDPTDKAPLMLLICLECGLRASEVTGIRVKDFQPEPGSVFIRSLKGSNPRELPLRGKRAAQLKKFILSRFSAINWNSVPQDASVFDITYQRFWQIWEFYRPNQEKGLHSLRHTFAVNFFRKTKDIKALQIALGHRQIDNTMVYLDFLYSQDVLRKLMYD